MKTACYLRVSTEDQTTASQKTEVADWLTRNGLTEDSVTWYEDVETGKTLDRPAMHRLRSAIEAGQVDTIVVQRLDRTCPRHGLESIN